MRIIVFGVGRFYQKRREILKQYQTVEIVAFSDNDKNLWGKVLEDVRLISPVSIKITACDGILIMSTYASEIEEQLITDGVDRGKILFWESFYAQLLSGKMKVLGKADGALSKSRSILIISTILAYND